MWFQNHCQQNNRENLSDGSVIAAQLTGLGDLVLTLISDREGSRVFTMALMAIGWVLASWQPRGWHALVSHWHWRPGLGLQTLHLAAAGDWRLFENWAFGIWAGEFLRAKQSGEANSSFCLHHYRRYLCEIDTIRAGITNRFLKWVLCPKNYMDIPTWQSKCFQCTLKFSWFSNFFVKQYQDALLTLLPHHYRVVHWSKLMKSETPSIKWY